MADLKGGILRPNAAIQEDYTAAVLSLVRRLGEAIKREVTKCFEEHAADAAMDANISSQARIALSALQAKYEPLFSRLAKRATKRMIARTLKNSDVTLGLSLKKISEKVTLSSASQMTPRMQEIITAATNEAAGLIKLIPQKYISEVQGQVMRSITTGQGLKDLQPYLEQKYGGNVKHARNVSLDQTRKAYQTITAQRCQDIGVQEYEWIHTGGSTHPRPEHIAMNGKVYRFDDPPIIVPSTGERGIPGQAIFCRCVMRPRISFGE